MLKVGSPHPAVRPGARDTWYFVANSNGLDLIVVMGRPTNDEVEDYRKGQATVGLAKAGDHTLMLVAKFGRQPWSDAPFASGLEPIQRRLLLPRGTEEGRLLNVTLVDGHTGLVRVLRVVSLSPAWCAVLDGLLAEQREILFDAQAQSEEAEEAYERWPTSEAVLKDAIIVEEAGKQETWNG